MIKYHCDECGKEVHTDFEDYVWVEITHHVDLNVLVTGVPSSDVKKGKFLCASCGNSWLEKLEAKQ